MSSARFSFTARDVDANTHGVAVPVLRCSESERTAQLLGTVHTRRGRWNPFLPDNDMKRTEQGFSATVTLSERGGRHCDGVYALRFSLDHDLRKSWKFDLSALDSTGKPTLVSGNDATRAHNLMFRVRESGEYRVDFDPVGRTYSIAPEPDYLSVIDSVQLNGFVWDAESDFEKFDERRPSHQMDRKGTSWVLTIPLLRDGGISFRKDGIYQFLFSVNQNEDWGFGGDNERPRGLAGGTGFGSSGGRSTQSAITIQVFDSGDYTFQLEPEDFRFSVSAENGKRPPRLLNGIRSMQLLGSFYGSQIFDPLDPSTQMREASPGVWEKTLEVAAGVHVLNFALSNELFLDTMALGAWMVDSERGVLRGRAWHGKPNEPNVLLRVHESTRITVRYDLASDEFTLEPSIPFALEPIWKIETLELIGDMTGWEPDVMQRHGSSFVKDVKLEAQRTYGYKYRANGLPWLWTFADYELDGYGRDLLTRNEDPHTRDWAALREFGHLTTHGNPAAMTFTPAETGIHRFFVDLETGLYGVSPP